MNITYYDELRQQFMLAGRLRDHVEELREMLAECIGEEGTDDGGGGGLFALGVAFGTADYGDDDFFQEKADTIIDRARALLERTRVA